MDMMDVPIFIGDEDDGDLEFWIKWMKQDFSAVSNFTEDYKLAMAWGYLSHDAEAWLVQAESFDAWETLKQGLVLSFGDVSNEFSEIKQNLDAKVGGEMDNKSTASVFQQYDPSRKSSHVLPNMVLNEGMLLDVADNNEDYLAHQVFDKIPLSVQQKNFRIQCADSRNEAIENSLQLQNAGSLQKLRAKKCTKTWKFKFKNGGIEQEWLGHLGTGNVCVMEFLQDNLNQQLTSQYTSLYTITTLLPTRHERSFYTSKKIPFTSVLGRRRNTDTWSKILCFVLQCCAVVAKFGLDIKEISILFRSNSQSILGDVNASDFWLELLVMGKGTHSSKKWGFLKAVNATEQAVKVQMGLEIWSAMVSVYAKINCGSYGLEYNNLIPLSLSSPTKDASVQVHGLVDNQMFGALRMTTMVSNMLQLKEYSMRQIKGHLEAHGHIMRSGHPFFIFSDEMIVQVKYVGSPFNVLKDLSYADDDTLIEMLLKITNLYEISNLLKCFVLTFVTKNQNTQGTQRIHLTPTSTLSEDRREGTTLCVKCDGTLLLFVLAKPLGSVWAILEREIILVCIGKVCIGYIDLSVDSNKEASSCKCVLPHHYKCQMPLLYNVIAAHQPPAYFISKTEGNITAESSGFMKRRTKFMVTNDDANIQAVNRARDESKKTVMWIRKTETIDQGDENGHREFQTYKEKIFHEEAKEKLQQLQEKISIFENDEKGPVNNQTFALQVTNKPNVTMKNHLRILSSYKKKQRKILLMEMRKRLQVAVWFKKINAKMKDKPFLREVAFFCDMEGSHALDNRAFQITRKLGIDELNRGSLLSHYAVSFVSVRSGIMPIRIVLLTVFAYDKENSGELIIIGSYVPLKTKQGEELQSQQRKYTLEFDHGSLPQPPEDQSKCFHLQANWRLSVLTMELGGKLPLKGGSNDRYLLHGI